MKPVQVAAAVVVVYILSQAAQLAVTPMAEAMDFFGHLAYVAFFSDQGRAPTPDEESIPAWVARLEAESVAPDASASGERYRAWAAQTPAAREQSAADALTQPRSADYVAPNYQSQHPPLYYWVLSRLYRALGPGLRLDGLVYALSLASICLAALGLPALYLIARLYVDEQAAWLGVLAVAWYPNLLVFLGRITNDALAFPLIAWGLYGCCLARQTRSNLPVVGAGVLFTLAAFTKTYALTLFPVYVLCALASTQGAQWRRFGLAAALTLAGLGALFLFNYLTTGHLILLTQVRLTDAVPLAERLRALIEIDPIWFLGGLVKGFWWSGDWSFVSPGVVYYLPLALIGGAAAVALVWRRGVETLSPWALARELWPHGLSLLCFVAGMAWHAATFTVFARQVGLSVHSGNEGWYANVLIGSVLAIGLVIVTRRVAEPWRWRLLAALAVFMIVWNLVARVTLAAYWSGLAGVTGRLRGLRWDEVFQALVAGRANVDGWLSLPGVIQPVWATSLLPLAAALVLSAGLLRSLRAANRRASESRP